MNLSTCCHYTAIMSYELRNNRKKNIRVFKIITDPVQSLECFSPRFVVIFSSKSSAASMNEIKLLANSHIIIMRRGLPLIQFTAIFVSCYGNSKWLRSQYHLIVFSREQNSFIFHFCPILWFPTIELSIDANELDVQNSKPIYLLCTEFRYEYSCKKRTFHAIETTNIIKLFDYEKMLSLQICVACVFLI